MSIIDTLITDRTAADKAQAEQLNAKGWENMTSEERTLYLSDQLKGAYKASDFNRVEAAVEYVASKINASGTIVVVSTRTWADSDVPTAEEYEAYRQNIVALRAALAVLPGTPSVPESIPALTIEEANHIEQILLNIDSMLDLMAAAPIFSGEIYAGEV